MDWIDTQNWPNLVSGKQNSVPCKLSAETPFPLWFLLFMTSLIVPLVFWASEVCLPQFNRVKAHTLNCLGNVTLLISILYVGFYCLTKTICRCYINHQPRNTRSDTCIEYRLLNDPLKTFHTRSWNWTCFIFSPAWERKEERLGLQFWYCNGYDKLPRGSYKQQWTTDKNALCASHGVDVRGRCDIVVVVVTLLTRPQSP